MSLLRGLDRRCKGRVWLLVWCMVCMPRLVIGLIALLVQSSVSAVILRAGRDWRTIILRRVRRFCPRWCVGIGVMY
jgi:hypothetical protein